MQNYTDPDSEIGNKSPTNEELLTVIHRAIQADTLLKEAKTSKVTEDIKILPYKWWIGVFFIGVAASIHAGILYASYNLVFYENQTELVKVFAISSAVLSFVVIYGIIIRSTIVSPQESKDDSNSNFSLRDIIETSQKFSDGG